MARRSRSRKGSRKSYRRQRGGYPAPDPSSYSSAATYQLAVNGDGNSQYNRVFDINGPDGRIPGNQIVGVQGQNLGYPASVSMKGGKRRMRKGGFLGTVVNQAVVPFSLLGMQQTYRRGKKGGKKTRKYRRH